MKKTLTFIALTTLLAAAPAHADIIDYIDENGNPQTANANAVTSSTATLTDGWWHVTGNVTTTNLTVTGHARLILTDASTLTAVSSPGGHAGIEVPDTDALTIYGQPANTGTLNAIGHGIAPGIAAGNAHGAGSVTIIGGTVNATGGILAPGIGADFYGGIVTIRGGIVNANGGTAAPGIRIGGTTSVPGNIIGNIDRGHPGALTITGGNVTFTDDTDHDPATVTTTVTIPPRNATNGDILNAITVTGKTPGATLTVNVTTSAIGAYTYRATTDATGTATVWLPDTVNEAKGKK